MGAQGSRSDRLGSWSRVFGTSCPPAEANAKTSPTRCADTLVLPRAAISHLHSPLLLTALSSWLSATLQPLVLVPGTLCGRRWFTLEGVPFHWNSLALPLCSRGTGFGGGVHLSVPGRQEGRGMPGKPLQ